MLLNSKYSIPECSTRTLVRERLLEAFDLGDEHSVVTIVAPAGYGKTTLVSTWAAQQDSAIAWYSLDSTDNEAAQFASYLVESVHRATGNGVSNAYSYVRSSQQVNANAAIAALLKDLARLPNALDIVLDDAHAINNSEVKESLQFLLRHLPMGVRVVMTSRSQLKFGLAALRMQGSLREITEQDLAFNTPEIESWVARQLNFELSREQLNRLANMSEGWAPVVQLFLLSARDAEVTESLLSQIEQGHKHILEYLAEEVVSKMDDDTRAVLRTASILERFTASMVQSLSGIPRVQSILESAVEKGLFLQPLDSTNQWFRFHSLFARFLERTLTDGARRDLHRAAYLEWMSQNVFVQALRHAIKADAPELVVALVKQHGQEIFNRGHYRALSNCFEFIGDEEVVKHPEFSLLAARIARSSYDYDRVERLLAKSESYLLSTDASKWDYFEGVFATVRAQSAIAKGEVANAREYAEEALDLLPVDLTADIAAATLVIAETSFCRGDLDEAFERLVQVEKATRMTEDWATSAWAICQQAEILFAKGQPFKAQDKQRLVEALVEEKHLSGLPIAEFVYRLKAQLHWEWYQLDEAENAAKKGLSINRIVGEKWMLQEYAQLAKVSLAKGDRDACEYWLEAIEQLMQREQYHRDWVAHADYSRIAIWEALDKKSDIERWLRTTEACADTPSNHFEQRHGRNHVRALMCVGQFADASRLLRRLTSSAKQHGLITDKLRNLVLTAQIKWLQNQRSAALNALHEAIKMSIDTQFSASFLRCGKPIIVMLKALLKEHDLADTERLRVETLLDRVQKQPELSGQLRIEIDLSLVDEIMAHEDTPEMLKRSPLTPKEWQVLNLIHLGFSNGKIAEHMQVAPSTIKTHIRAIYQKLELKNRAEAVELTERLLRTIQSA